MILVSVIVPIYNTERYIDNCLLSIVRQSYRNIEIILINDGSTDSSYQICNIWQKKDKRIRLFSQSNKGAAAARNFGMSVASGEYICFVDSDDEIALSYVSDMVEALLKYNSQLVICGLSHKYINKLIKKDFSGDYLTGDFFKDYKNLHYFLQSPCLKLYCRDIIVKHDITFPENMRQLEDEVFNIRYNYWVINYSVVNKCNYIYNHRGIATSLSSSINDNFINDVIRQISEEIILLHNKEVEDGDVIINAHICVHALSLVIKSSKYSVYVYGIKKLMNFSQKSYAGLPLSKKIVFLLLKKGIYFPLYGYGKFFRQR